MPGLDAPRGGSRDDQEPTAPVPEEQLSAETQAAFLAMQAASLRAEDPDKAGPAKGESESGWQALRQRRSFVRLLMFMVILLAIASLGAGAVAIARTFLSGDATTVDGAASEALVGSLGTAPSSASSAVTGAAVESSSCVVPDGAVTLLVQEVVNRTGKADPAMFVVTWELALKNVSDAEVTVSTRWATSSDAVMSEGWTGVGLIVAPGATQLASNMVNNNDSGRSGALEWYYVDRVLVLPIAPECSDLHRDPSVELEQRALVSPVPALPAGVELPGTS